MITLVMDIETLPLPQELLLASAPEFTAARNLKDPAKIEASIAEKRAKYLEDAALSALTARIAIAGFAVVDIETRSIEEQFAFDIGALTEQATVINAIEVIRKYDLVTGYNIKHFDLSFLCQRAMLLGIDCAGIRQCYHGRWSWHERFVDLAEVWSCGERDIPSLETLSKAFGLGEKLGKGSEFPMLWQTDRNQALAYNARDVEIESRLAMRML